MKPLLKCTKLRREQNVAGHLAHCGHAVVLWGVGLLPCQSQAECQGLYDVYVQGLRACNNGSVTKESNLLWDVLCLFKSLVRV